MMTKHTLGIGAALATLALTVTACGGAAAGPADEGGNQATEMTVSLLPTMDVLPVQLAIQEGIFEEHGLKVESMPSQGGASTVPSVLEGSIDVAFGNPMTYFQGLEKGLPLAVAFMGGAEERAEGEPGAGHTASVIVVNEDSPIQTPADLEGKVVSVNSVGNIQEVAVKNAIDKAGGDPDTVQLLELPLSQAQSALESGRIDAASVNDPFTSTMIKDGMRPIGDTLLGIDGVNANLELYYTSRQFAADNPQALEAFRTAVNEAIDIINEDPERARDALRGYTEIDDSIVDQLAIHHFQKGVSHDEVAALIGAAKKYGVLEDGDKVTAEKVMEETPTGEDK
jgi:ABC-type nitrate/sulfonate/bicarbonate transport system substrate-binding protein